MKSARSRRSRSGQAMVEYILMTLMIVSVIVGVLAGVVKPYLDQMQAHIEARASKVVAQDELGIPLEWFLGSAKSFNDVDKKLAGAGKDVSDQAGGNGDAGGGSGKDAGQSAGGGGDAGGPGGRGGRGGGGGGGPGVTSPTGSDKTLGRAGSGGSGRGGAGGDGSDGGDSGSKKRKKSGGSSDSGSVESSETKTPDAKVEDEKNSQEEGGGKGAEDEESSGGGVRGPKKDFGRDGEVRQGRGCAEMDMFTLLKIGAVLAILLLGAAVLVTAKGQKGD